MLQLHRGSVARSVFAGPRSHCPLAFHLTDDKPLFPPSQIRGDAPIRCDSLEPSCFHGGAQGSAPCQCQHCASRLVKTLIHKELWQDVDASEKMTLYGHTDAETEHWTRTRCTDTDTTPQHHPMRVGQSDTSQRLAQ